MNTWCTTGLDPMEQLFACTLQISRNVWPSQPGYGLLDLAAPLGIQTDQGNPEFEATACVAVALAALHEIGCESLEDLVETRRFEFGILSASVRQFRQWKRWSDDEYDDWLENLPEMQRKHFALVDEIDYLYGQRDVLPDALDKCVAACERLIAFAPEVATSMRAHSPRALPRHSGYDHLAIICEERNEFEAALRLSRQARGQGWSGDWDERIARLKTEIDRQKAEN